MEWILSTSTGEHHTVKEYKTIGLGVLGTISPTQYECSHNVLSVGLLLNSGVCNMVVFDNGGVIFVKKKHVITESLGNYPEYKYKIARSISGHVYKFPTDITTFETKVSSLYSYLIKNAIEPDSMFTIATDRHHNRVPNKKYMWSMTKVEDEVYGKMSMVTFIERKVFFISTFEVVYVPKSKPCISASLLNTYNNNALYVFPKYAVVCRQNPNVPVLVCQNVKNNYLIMGLPIPGKRAAAISNMGEGDMLKAGMTAVIRSVKK